jgi:hypothetical protein
METVKDIHVLTFEKKVNMKFEQITTQNLQSCSAKKSKEDRYNN